LVNEVRADAQRRKRKRAMQSMLAILRHYLQGLALLLRRPRLAQELQDREQRLKELKSSLKNERREVRRLKKQSERTPPVGGINFGDLRRSRPISRDFGYNRGLPIDRYYIENFLAHHAADIRGRVLEIKDASYTTRYGADRVEISDVLDVAEHNRQATIVADLTRADHVAADAFDCIIFTQVLQLIYDMRSAVQTLYRTLKPGGVLLATFPGVTQVPYKECGDSWCWAFTSLSVRRLFEETFSPANVSIEAHGNVLAATSFLHGLAVEELSQDELDYHDPDYALLITLRAVRPQATL
jgi:SAM-dependent methyltransferase